MDDIVNTVEAFVSNLNGSAGYVIALLQIVNDSSENRLFTFISGIKFHSDGDLVCVDEQPQPNKWFGFVFLRLALQTEIVFFVNFKVKVGAVKNNKKSQYLC